MTRLVLIAFISLFVFFACPSKKAGSMPYNDLSAEKVVSVTVQLLPGKKTGLSDDEIMELVGILKTFEAKKPDNSHNDMGGQCTQFTLEMAGGSYETVTLFGRFIILNGDGYKDSDEILSKLNKLAGAIFSRANSSTESIVLYPRNPNVLRVGSEFCIELDENQSIPYRWEYAISNDILVKPSHVVLDPGTNISQMPGSGGEIRVFYFDALGAGECQIEMAYKDIRDGMADEVVIYVVVIED
ncbi:MAG: protease inhibitor I42 family protein [Eubacteriaceae bacterium]|nr:protease inhibitor I42 family protein [Eubacteriaceae bacterium]